MTIVPVHKVKLDNDKEVKVTVESRSGMTIEYKDGRGYIINNEGKITGAYQRNADGLTTDVALPKNPSVVLNDAHAALGKLKVGGSPGDGFHDGYIDRLMSAIKTQMAPAGRPMTPKM